MKRFKRGNYAIFDSEATYSCIKPEFAGQLEMPLPLSEIMEFETAETGRILKAEKKVLLSSR